MGSVIGMADAAGAATATIMYDAFGNVTSSSGPAAAIPNSVGTDFRYHGMQLDAATGLYHVRARTYDARTGRFTSRDPAEALRRIPENFHPYVFSNGDPHLFVDPSGEFSVLAVAVGVTAAAFLATTAIAYLRLGASSDEGNFYRRRSPDDDEYLTLGEANWWYQYGNGDPLTVALSKLDLSDLRYEDFFFPEARRCSDGTALCLAFGTKKPWDFLVLGTITLRMENGIVTAFPDKYDFEQHDYSGDPRIDARRFVRNVETRLGGAYAGRGTPFPINIAGQIVLEARPLQLD